MKIITYLILLLFFTSCDSIINLNLKRTTKIVVTKISFTNNKLIIQGSGLNSALKINITSNSFNESFNVEQKSESEIIAAGSRAFNFDVTKIFSLILSDAYGSATFPIQFQIQSAFNSSSGVDYGFQITPTSNASGTAGYTALKVDVTETSTGSGNKLLTDMQVNGVSKFSVDSNGNITTAGQLRTDSVDASMMSSNGNFNIPNVSHSQIWLGNLPSGDNDIFTVPAGKRAYVTISLVNPTVGAIPYYQSVKLGSNYYKIAGSTSLAAKGNSSGVYSNLWLEEGESFAISSSAPGLNVFGTAYIIPNTSELKTIKLKNFAVGMNTIYTVPAGKRAYGMGFSLFYGTSGSNSLVICFNNTGSARNYVIYHVPNGQSAGTLTMSAINSALATNAGIPSVTSMVLNSGDSIEMSTDSAIDAQLCWTAIVEK